jgi:hypothetical protein
VIGGIGASVYVKCEECQRRSRGDVAMVMVLKYVDFACKKIPTYQECVAVTFLAGRPF